MSFTAYSNILVISGANGQILSPYGPGWRRLREEPTSFLASSIVSFTDYNKDSYLDTVILDFSPRDESYPVFEGYDLKHDASLFESVADDFGTTATDYMGFTVLDQMNTSNQPADLTRDGFHDLNVFRFFGQGPTPLRVGLFHGYANGSTNKGRKVWLEEFNLFDSAHWLANDFDGDGIYDFALTKSPEEPGVPSAGKVTWTIANTRVAASGMTIGKTFIYDPTYDYAFDPEDHEFTAAVTAILPLGDFDGDGQRDTGASFTCSFRQQILDDPDLGYGHLLVYDNTPGLLPPGISAEMQVKTTDGWIPGLIYGAAVKLADGAFVDNNHDGHINELVVDSARVVASVSSTYKGDIWPTPTASPQPTPTAPPSPTPAPTATIVPTITPQPTPTTTPLPTPTSTVLPSPTLTPLPSPTATPLPTPSSTATPSVTPTTVPSITPTPQPTASATPTPITTPVATPTPTCAPLPTPAGYDLSEVLDLKALYKGDGNVDEAALAQGRILITGNSSGRIQIKPKKGESPDIIPLVECDGSVKKFETAVPIHAVRIEDDLKNFNARGAYVRSIEAGALGRLKMAAMPDSNDTFFVALKRTKDSGTDLKANVTLSGVTLTSLLAPDQTASVSVASKKKKDAVYPGAIAPRPGCEAQSVIEAEELPKIAVNGGVLNPHRIKTDKGTTAKIMARSAQGFAGDINPGTIESGADKLSVESIGGNVLTQVRNDEASSIKAAGRVIKLSAKSLKGEGGLLGVYQTDVVADRFGGIVGQAAEGIVALEVIAGDDDDDAGIGLIRGDAGINGRFITGKIDSDCEGQGLIQKMQTSKEAKIRGEVFVSDPEKIKFVGDVDHEDLKINPCPAAP